MSLMRLLAAGKSLIGLKHPHSPYKLVQRSWFPIFGSARFADPPAPPAAPETRESSDLERLASPPTVVPFPTTGPSAENRRSFLERILSPRSSAAPNRGFIQGELSLESVKVMRNDLSDADVEVLRVSPKAKATYEVGAKKASPVKEMPATSWGQVTARMLEVDEPRS